MRREIYRMDRARAVDFLRRAPFVHLATTNAAGEPLLRTVHGVLVDDWLCFHGAPAGEKMESIGRPAVVSWEDVVAEIPSWFIDPERACPATTYYESVQLHGLLESVDDPLFKARVLQALMERFQPEGRHIPISADHAMYKKAVEGILIVRVSLERLDGKSKLGQNRTRENIEAVLEHLWRRGTRGDLRAIERVRAAHGLPLAGPAGTTLSVQPTREDAHAVAALLEGTYWSIGISNQQIARSQLGSPAWLVAHAPDGRVVSTARAIADGAKHAFILDVITHPEWRGRGLAHHLVGLLLDHPHVRGTHIVRLNTRDAERLYQRFGFRTIHRDVTDRLTMQLDRA
jgi:predicted FMN-binding regulatory protein PaiB/N-acetylglutamate synthase-like GNAT family acetyltransferase